MPEIRMPDAWDTVRLATAYRTMNPVSESRLGQLAAGNPIFYARLRDGGSCTIRLYGRVLQWFSDHWPAHLEWPSDVPRPAPASEAKEAA